MPQTIAGMLLLIGANLAIAGLYELVQALTGGDPGAATTMKATISLPVLIVLTLINPLYDELFAVAYVVRATEGSGAAFAITLSAIVRFVCHLDQGPIAAIGILPLGIIFAIVYWRWRLVWPLVVAHGVMDFLGLMPQA
jgi:membrane protease YdiL (CAAX protease family)